MKIVPANDGAALDFVSFQFLDGELVLKTGENNIPPGVVVKD